MNGLLVLVLFDISLDCSEQVLADFFFFFPSVKGQIINILDLWAIWSLLQVVSSAIVL